MTTLYLVRHAKPAATWGEATDPGLDALGATQAAQAATELQRHLSRLTVYTSPLRRCVETAAPLASLWQTTAQILTQVAEVPSPPLSITERQQWLHSGMQGTWTELQANSPPGSPDFSAWRRTLLTTLQTLQTDSVIFSHYIAINVVVGAAQGHERVISFRPGHASITQIEVTSAGFTVKQLGQEVDGGSILLGR